MFRYRRILEMHSEGISIRSIAASTGNSRQKITEVDCQHFFGQK